MCIDDKYLKATVLELQFKRSEVINRFFQINNGNDSETSRSVVARKPGTKPKRKRSLKKSHIVLDNLYSV